MNRNVIEKARRINIHLKNKTRPNKNDKQKQKTNEERQTKRKEIRNCWKWESCLTADG